MFLQKILYHEIGENIPNLEINWQKATYGVLNERAIRASAGLMFLIGILTFFIVFSTKNILYILPTLTLFWIQFFIAVFFSPRYAPFSLVGRWIVRKQKPEYVWAIQKRFAWFLGLFMATLMAGVLLIQPQVGPLPFFICWLCLSFMWLESSCWICVWCRIYGFLLAKKVISEPDVRPACPGWACSFVPKIKKEQ